MKSAAVLIVLSCLLVTSVFGLSEETKNRIIHVYNITRNQYALIIGLIEDLDNSKIEESYAEEKLSEWKERYREKVRSMPKETKKMCELMEEIIEAAKEAADDYQPNHQRTKDKLDDLEEIKEELMDEMTDIKYMVQ